jgi:hypothetical protein
VLADGFGPTGIEIKEDLPDIGKHKGDDPRHPNDLLASLFDGDGRGIDDPLVEIAGAGLGRIDPLGMAGGIGRGQHPGDRATERDRNEGG